jgi:hypothetical protein
MTSLMAMRLAAMARTGRALAPLIGALVVLGTIYGGGAAQAGEAYGFSAAVMFPVLAWQTKILLDAEPDVQRRLASVAIGSRHREWISGLFAAAVAALVVVVLALVVPWLIGGVTGPQAPEDPSLGDGLIAGVWAHLLLVPPALALGAISSRAVTGNVARGLSVLVLGSVLAFVLGMRSSPVPWLVPPLLAVGRSSTAGLAPAAMTGFTLHATVWTAAVLALYAQRRIRAA